MSRLGVTPGRLVLIAALSGVLLYVLRGMPSSDVPLAASLAVASPAKKSSPPASADRSVTSLDRILKHDPFTPVLRDPPEAAEDEPTPNLSSENPAPSPSANDEASVAVAGRVRLIYRGGGRSAAMIDSQVVREGDRFGGATVREIRADGVVLDVSEPAGSDGAAAVTPQ